MGLRTITSSLCVGAALLLLPTTLAGEENMDTSCEAVPLTNTAANIFDDSERVVHAAPLNLARGPHLFLDGYLIESSRGVARVVNKPRRDPAIPNPIITGKEDGGFQPYFTVLRSPDTGRFRIWYGHRTEDSNAGRSHIGYMESADGIHWERPAKVLADAGPNQFGCSIVDEGPNSANPQQRYKLAWWYDGGMNVAASPDGFNWSMLAEKPVLRHNHDITSIFLDPIRKRYMGTISVYRQGGLWSGDRRITMQAYSRDLLTWADAHYVVTPSDGLDEGQTQFYAMDGFLVRGDLIVGMVKVLRDDLKADDPPDPPEAYGVGYTSLAWTRDGYTWYRDREHFFDPNPEKGTWDHAHAWIDEQVLVDDYTYLYYGGYARGHKVNRFEERQIGLVKIKRDRYVAREAGETPGTLTTAAFVLDTDAIRVNVETMDGVVTAQIIDQDGLPIPGFTDTDCTPITGDHIDTPLAWKRALSELKDKAIRIEFTLQKARLYGFTLE